MKNYARVIEGVAVDVSMAPHEHFHPIVAAQFSEVPLGVAPGWSLVNNQWHAPQAIESGPPLDAAINYPTVGLIHFKMLFSADERLKAKELRTTDAILNDFWELIEDSRTDIVNLGLQSVQAAVQYTLEAVKAAGIEIDVPTRKAAILSGVLQ